MAGLLYYREQSLPLRLSDISVLHYAFDRVPMHTESRGPNGGSGILFADEPRLNGKPLKFDAASQTWKKIGTGLWCGYYTDAKPEPIDLARSKTVDGYEAELADGNKWVVPLCRIFTENETEQSKLPRYRDINEHGQWFDGDYLDRYQRLAEICREFFDRWHAGLKAAAEGDSAEWSVKVEDNDAVALLAANYVVGPGEVALLKLFDNSGIVETIMMLACDCGKAYRFILQKKTEAVSTG